MRDGVEYRINLQGFRDREFSDPSCGTAKRIVVIGDSVAWGWGVPMDQVWPQLLETKLNVVPGGDHTCIFNLAVNGYATPQEIRLLETRGLNYHPDIVILNYVLNDTEVEDGGLSAYFQASSRIELWYQARMLYSFVKMACINWLEDANIIQHGANEVSTSDVDHFFLTHETLFQPVETGFSRLSTLAKQNDFSVMVIVSPVFQFEKNGRYKWKPIHEKLRQLSLNNGFQFLDLQPGFINYDGKEVSFDPIHPNILGHKIIAEEVFTVLQKNKN